MKNYKFRLIARISQSISQSVSQSVPEILVGGNYFSMIIKRHKTNMMFASKN